MTKTMTMTMTMTKTMTLSKTKNVSSIALSSEILTPPKERESSKGDEEL